VRRVKKKLGYYSKQEAVDMSSEADSITMLEQPREGNALRVLGWFSVGMAVAALSFYVGRELRSRYKFKKRTPYDFYSRAGESQTAEFGMGI
jgi:hypothetical protein